MPGRHGGGPLGGGGGFGGGMRGGGGFGGGGFGGGMRGGGGFGGGGMRPGGGWGGGGWGGGGWRPRGPWGPRFGGWGGWGGRWYGWGFWPWVFVPRMFGWGGYPGYGYGMGGGLAGIGCLIMLIIGLGCLCATFSGGFSAFRGFNDSGYNSGYGYGSNNNYNTSGDTSSTGSAFGGKTIADEAGPVQTQTAKDLTELHQAFDQRISTWESQLAPNDAKSIPPADAGLTQDNNTKEVLYGKCGTAFYLYVVELSKPDNVPATGEGYIYTTASSPGACHPPQYTVYDSEDVSGGWYFAYFENGQQ